MKLFDSIKNVSKQITGRNKAEEEWERLNEACKTYDRNRKSLLSQAQQLYAERKLYLKTILQIQKELRKVSGIPDWGNKDLGDSLIRLEGFVLAVQYENNPAELAKLDKSGKTKAFVGAGMAAGGAAAIWGSSAAMSLATVLGTASTGTAIGALSGVAATNAALAWLGGGAVAAGGAGMAGGQLLLTMFGPIGWAIAGVSGAAGFMAIRSKNKKMAEELHSKYNEIMHDNREMTEKLRHLKSLIYRGKAQYEDELMPSFLWVKAVKPKDFEKWDQKDQLAYERALSNVSMMAMLINERI